MRQRFSAKERKVFSAIAETLDLTMHEAEYLFHALREVSIDERHKQLMNETASDFEIEITQQRIYIQ